MKILTSVALLATTVLLGCSTPQPVEPRHGSVSVETVAPKQVQSALLAQVAELQPYLAPPSNENLPDVFKGKPCQLGKSCLAMDPRPFEICLLGTNKRCGDKAREPLLVGNPEADPR